MPIIGDDFLPFVVIVLCGIAFASNFRQNSTKITRVNIPAAAAFLPMLCPVLIVRMTC